MANADPGRFQVHLDAEFFREAVAFTAAETGFGPRLIEKDYYCSLLISELCRATEDLVFKGGTCLAKVHADFYRLSEDLDWTIHVEAGTKRAQRRTLASGVKQAVLELADRYPELELQQPLAGANQSTQYVGAVAYRSGLSGETEPVKIEVGLREPLLTPAEHKETRTLMLNPLTGRSLIASFASRCISLPEAYAEKFRAALCRLEPAIRDFYDLHHAATSALIVPHDDGLLELIKRKIMVPGNDPVDVSDDRLDQLRMQLEAQLKPVLRAVDFESFDLDRTFNMVRTVAGEVQ